jgi:hypothetical protein
MSDLQEIVNGLPSGAEHTALQMLVEVNDVHHHEVAALTARINTLERNVAAMSTPEAVASRGAASALERAVDDAYSVRDHEHNYLEIYIIYRETASTRTGEYKIGFHNTIMGQWTQINLWPFSVMGDMSLDDAADYPRLVKWDTIEQFKGGALPLLQSGSNGWTIASISFINSADGLVEVYEAAQAAA